MAFIGMRHVVAAEIATESAGSEPTYSTGFDVGLAIAGNLTVNRNDNPLYADDAIAEDDNGITGMELELGLDDLSEETEADMGLVKKVETSTGEGQSAVTTVTYYDTDEPSKELGVGYIRVRRKAGVTKYQAVWVYKAKFSKNSENTATKGENIDWQTPTVNGRCVGLDTDGSGVKRFRKKQVFTSESAAAAWLDGLAGITRT